MTVVIPLAAIALLTATDQIIKYFVQQFLQPVGEIPFIDGIIGWRYLRNTGAAFGSFSDFTIPLSIFTGIVLAVGLYLIIAKKIKSKFYLVCAVMIISGGLGNLIDRIFRHYVVDYIEVRFMNFAVFNFADILVTVGAIMLIVYLIVDIFRDGKRVKKSE